MGYAMKPPEFISFIWFKQSQSGVIIKLADNDKVQSLLPDSIVDKMKKIRFTIYS